MNLRSRLFSFILLCASAACITPASAQSGSSLGCIDTSIRRQAAEIKQHYITQGFKVYRDAMISMSSAQPFPVIVDLQRGALYQIIFVANTNSTRMKLTMLDGNDQELSEQYQQKNRNQPNYILFSHVPGKTDSYLFSIMQQWKQKDMCGSFSILKMEKPSATVVPYAGI